MNSVVRVSYKLPEDFPEIVADLIQKLVVCIFLLQGYLLDFILVFSVWNQVNDWVVMNQVE